MLRPKRKITKREIKQDPLLETLFSAQKFYMKNRKRILGVCGGLLVLILVMLVNSSWKSSNRATANEYLAKGIASYNNFDYTTAINELDLLVAEYPNTPAGRESLFYMGQAYLHLKNPTAAKHSLEKFQKKGRNDFLLGASLQALAAIAESEERYREAAELFQRASSMAEYAFNAQQNSINAVVNWLRAGEYNKASVILEDLQSIEDSHRLIRDQVDELSSKLKIVSFSSD